MPLSLCHEPIPDTVQVKERCFRLRSNFYALRKKHSLLHRGTLLMIQSNFIPTGKLKQMKCTDGTPSREVEEEWEEDEEMEKFKKAYQKPSVLDIRDELVRLIELVDVASTALMASPHPIHPIKVYGVMHSQVIPKLRELEKELARL